MSYDLLKIDGTDRFFFSFINDVVTSAKVGYRDGPKSNAIFLLEIKKITVWKKMSKLTIIKKKEKKKTSMAWSWQN